MSSNQKVFFIMVLISIMVLILMLILEVAYMTSEVNKGNNTDQLTRGFLPPRMTTTQRDAIVTKMMNGMSIKDEEISILRCEFRPPRMTAVQRKAIVKPFLGTLVEDENGHVWGYSKTGWEDLEKKICFYKSRSSSLN